MAEIAILKSTLAGHSKSVLSVAFHPTMPLLATGSEDRTAKLWRFEPDGSTVTCVATLEGNTNRVISVAFHPTATILATGGFREAAKLWRFSPDGSASNNMLATCVKTIEGDMYDGYRWIVAFHPTAPLFAISSGEISAKLWRFSPDGSTVTCVATLEMNLHSQDISSFAFHATAPLLATGSYDMTAK